MTFAQWRQRDAADGNRPVRKGNRSGGKSRTLGELRQYLGDNVPLFARALYNREQTPEVHGNLDTEILRLR
jgi:hypothetical protein